MPDRLDWIDVAKGVGIILVVLGHAGRGISAAGLPDGGGFLALMDQALYAFHIPLFFLLSGVVFGLRPPETIRPSLLNRTQRLFYSLVVWTYAYLALRALVGEYSNANGAWQDLLQLPLPPFAHFWFLWALGLNIVFFALVRLMLRPVVPDLWFWGGAVIFSVVLNGAVSLPQKMMPWFGPAVTYGTAFTVGGFIGASPLVRTRPGPGMAAGAGGLFLLGLWLTVSAQWFLAPMATGLVLSGLFLVPLIALSYRFDTSAVVRGLAFLGIISLAIYVMHTMFSAALRILLTEVGRIEMLTHLLLGTFVGLLGPACVYLAARKFGMLRILGIV